MPTTFNTTDPKPGYVYEVATDTWFPLLGIAPGSSIVRWRKTAVGAETSVSGLDDLSATLSYNAGTEQVYLNGVLLVRTEDYLATTGTSITGLTALAASDVIEVISFNATNVQITDALLETDINAKGDLIVGAAVDTAAILASGTNGQVLSVNTATATGLEWIANDQGDITGVTAGTGISGGGTSGTVTVTNSMATAIDAKGDLVAGTGADAFSRLAVGSNNTVLTADSAEATGLKWASASAAGSSYTLLNSGGTALSGSTTTISSISGQEKLLILVNGASSTSASSTFHMTINGDTGTKYDYSGGVIVAGSTYAASNFATYNGYGPNLPVGQMSAAAGSTTATSIAINGGTGTGGKQFQITNGVNATGSNGQYLFWLQGVYQGTATISSLEFVTSSGTFDAGTIFVYGSAV